MFLKNIGLKIKKILKNTKIRNGLMLGLLFCFIFVSSAKASLIEKITGDALSSPFIWMGNLVSFVANQIIILESKLLSLIVDASVFTKMPVVITGWKVARDFANLFFIALLVYVAFGYILRINTKNNQKLLVNIIVMAVLINFSLMIGGIIIDFSNVFFNYFLFGPSAGSSEGRGIYISNALANAFQLQKFLNYQEADDSLTPVQQKLENKFDDSSIGDKVFMSIVRLIFSIIFSFMVIVVLGALVGTLLVRLFSLWILLILAPLAWVVNLFPIPTLKRLGGEWWGNFLKQCFIAPVIGFFVYLALLTASNFKSLKFSDAYMAQFNQGLFGGSTNTMFNILSVLQLLLVIGFLVGGLMAGQKLGDGASKAALGFAKKTGDRAGKMVVSGGKKLAVGAATPAAKGIQKRLEKSSKGIKTVAALTGVTKLSRGIVAQSEENKKKANEKKMKKYEGYDKSQLEGIIKTFANDRHEKAAALAALAKKTDGDIGLKFKDNVDLLSKYGFNNEYKSVMKAHPEWNKKILETANNVVDGKAFTNQLADVISEEFKGKDPTEIKIPTLPDENDSSYKQLSAVRDGIIQWKAKTTEPKELGRSLMLANKNNPSQLNNDINKILDDIYKNDEQAQFKLLDSLNNYPLGAKTIEDDAKLKGIYENLLSKYDKSAMNVHPEWNKEILETANNVVDGKISINQFVEVASEEFKEKDPAEIKISTLPDKNDPSYMQLSTVRDGIIQWKAETTKPEELGHSLMLANKKTPDQLNSDINKLIDDIYKNDEQAQFKLLDSLNNYPLGAKTIESNDKLKGIFDNLKKKEIERKAKEEAAKEKIKEDSKKNIIYDQFGNPINQ